MFERFTEKAQRAVFFAGSHAVKSGASAIEPEHLLLGLAHAAPDRLNRFFTGQSSHGSIEDQVLKAAPPKKAARAGLFGTLARWSLKFAWWSLKFTGRRLRPAGKMPLGDQSKRALDHAAEESNHLGQKHIEVEHVLLGLLRQEKSVAARMLAERGASLEKVRNMLKGGSSGPVGRP